MIRVECGNCGRKIRGGDDWSGRSGNCPKCGAVILFPRIEAEFEQAIQVRAAAQQAPDVNADFFSVAKQWEFPNLRDAAIVAVAAVTGASIWIWMKLIVFLNFGMQSYFMARLRVVSANPWSGIAYNNGERLSVFYFSGLMVCEKFKVHFSSGDPS
jgi:DNA-directed RNA polymerase subunit RPC12/RpoP